MNLYDIRKGYIAQKYNAANASSRACQDVLLNKIAKSTLSENVTIKGGVIISHLSKDKRRATRDFDLDFIRYSLDDNSIRKFIDILNDVDDGITIKITEEIEELRHEEYQGKRISLSLSDKQNNTIGTKLDIGVHSKLNIEQVDYCFDLSNIGENVSLFVNSIEQAFAEKLASLLKFGRISTRYKDIFDIYYFIDSGDINKERLSLCFDEYIFKAKETRYHNITGINKRLKGIFYNKVFLSQTDTAQSNWLELPINEVTIRILKFLDNI
ncbi:MAG: nucleotidyl transferase AbiEii/AbiGii toxin family protein [Oscillospiraceae bacterium]|jgi:predicted nucleotidyltransferase component of viral defense system|nr:nucleotidyl transferase AbiEii/AbiGii toxin family protein [Oscillospiraceae bacterium]